MHINACIFVQHYNKDTSIYIDTFYSNQPKKKYTKDLLFERTGCFEGSGKVGKLPKKGTLSRALSLAENSYNRRLLARVRRLIKSARLVSSRLSSYILYYTPATFERLLGTAKSFPNGSHVPLLVRDFARPAADYLALAFRFSFVLFWGKKYSLNRGKK